jgi:D-alanine transaminase
VTEGASSNAWIVDKDGQLVTRTADPAILRGVTRMTLMDVLEREGVAFVERPFTVKEAKQAREAFLTSASSVVMPVVSIDGQAIGNGEPGLLTLRLRETFHRYAQVADP